LALVYLVLFHRPLYGFQRLSLCTEGAKIKLDWELVAQAAPDAGSISRSVGDLLRGDFVALLGSLRVRQAHSLLARGLVIVIAATAQTAQAKGFEITKLVPYLLSLR